MSVSSGTSTPRLASSGTQMMSERTRSGSSPPATAVTSFWWRSSYGTGTDCTSTSGWSCSNPGMIVFSSVSTSGESAL